MSLPTAEEAATKLDMALAEVGMAHVHPQVTLCLVCGGQRVQVRSTQGDDHLQNVVRKACSLIWGHRGATMAFTPRGVTMTASTCTCRRLYRDAP